MGLKRRGYLKRRGTQEKGINKVQLRPWFLALQGKLTQASLTLGRGLLPPSSCAARFFQAVTAFRSRITSNIYTPQEGRRERGGFQDWLLCLGCLKCELHWLTSEDFCSFHSEKQTACGHREILWGCGVELIYITVLTHLWLSGLKISYDWWTASALCLRNYNYTCPFLTWWTVWSVQGTCFNSAFRALYSDNTTGPMFTHDIFHSIPYLKYPSFFYPVSLSLSPPLSQFSMSSAFYVWQVSIERNLGAGWMTFPPKWSLALIVPINWDIVCM